MIKANLANPGFRGYTSSMVAPLAAALLAVSLHAAEALDPNTGCKSADQQVLTKSLEQAREWTKLARSRLNDGDDSDKSRLADMIGKDVFGAQYDRAKARDKLDEISQVLASPDLRCVHKDYSEWHYCDDNGGKTAAWEAFAQKHGAIYLCPRYFAKKGAKDDLWRIARLVHEASHVTGVGQTGGESYCVAGFSCEMSCGGKDDAMAVADNWAQFVHCASDHESTEEGLEITVSKPRRRKD